MAEIFLARANGMAGFERYVVLKRIRPERDDDPRWVTMFLDEARLAAQLQHPNIAQVFDLGQIADSFFYTMEFVHGEDVLDILSRTSALGQRMPLHISLAIAAGACTGLAYAHDRVGLDGQPLHIVHRDISPANLMVSFDGVVKVLDFGVAKARNRDTKTEAGTIMGKVAYLSPEQCQTNQLDHRSDLFSLGIVLYEMVTHVRPFKRGTDYETLAAIVRFDPPPPSTIVPNLPRGMDDLLMRALSKDPDRRFASAHDMLEAIEAVADAAQASLAPRDLKRYMRDLYGTPPEPWRTIGGDEVMGTFSGEVIGPLPTETRIKAFPADAVADDVPLLPTAARASGTPGAQHGDDLDDAAMTPFAAYRPVPARLPTDDLEEALPTPMHMAPIKVHPTIEAPPPVRTTPPALPAAEAPRGSNRMTAPHGAQSQSGRLPVPPVPATPPSGLPAPRVSGALPTPASGLPAPSGPFAVPASSGPMPVVGASGPYAMPAGYATPPGTMEVIAPASPHLALDTAAIRVVRPQDQRAGRTNRSWLIIVVTVLAVVGIGIGAIAAMGGGDKPDTPAKADTAGTPAAPPEPRPSVTPIEEPAPSLTGPSKTADPSKASAPSTSADPAKTAPAKTMDPAKASAPSTSADPTTTADPAKTTPAKTMDPAKTTTAPVKTTTTPAKTTDPAKSSSSSSSTSTTPGKKKDDKKKKPPANACTDPLECMQ